MDIAVLAKVQRFTSAIQESIHTKTLQGESQIQDTHRLTMATEQLTAMATVHTLHLRLRVLSTELQRAQTWSLFEFLTVLVQEQVRE
jgi:hypothetical protein